MKNQGLNPSLIHSALGIAIQKRRLALGLSQDEVARRSELHRTYLSDVERHSRNFSIRIYLRLAIALEISPSELMAMAEKLAYSEPKTGPGKTSKSSKPKAN